ncbi:MAG TPA: bifunctional diaminohydroxyphosphoribosylaminopyrimidine deaminase/5-amino-6-(5-phosphoribosylamino)uracil reductase RibD [Vicinamibacterales bacterium]|nr:bifunctional diaminohydroxyphosphoribosylaminopyrimidine deaminase/5-amino-6-(5-phosphoribosylamino)uracil reductase RibD [Vicinamibacterales bacterium]
MTTTADAAWMARACDLAERGRGRTTPNPIVGAVVVTPDGVVVGQGAHLEAGGPHAEVHALDMAGDRARGATLYCTLEPCRHHGRTGPCVERIVNAGVVRVVAATADPNPRVSGTGFALLRARGVEVVEGVLRARAERQHAPFFTWIVRKRPWIILKSAISRDGFVGHLGRRAHLTGPAANRHLHRQRAEVDAIAVGAGTVLVDDPLLTARGAYRARPLVRVIVDWRARVPQTARVWSTLEAGPVIMVVGHDVTGPAQAHLRALSDRGVTIEPADRHDLAGVLTRLAARDVLTLLVEGGPRLQAACYRGGWVDRVQWVFTPHEMGDGEPVLGDVDRPLRWALPPSVTRLGDDTLVEWDVHGTD